MTTNVYKIGEICSIVRGTYPTMKTEPGKYPLVVTAAFRRSASTYQMEGPAVCVPLISSTGHGDAALHRVHYQEGKFALANLLVALIPKDKGICNPKYLYHLLMAKKDEYFVPLMLGTANVSLKEQDIAGVEVALPPLDEQRRVVSFIEELAKQVEEARRLRRETIEETEAILPAGSRRVFDIPDADGWRSLTVEECCEELIDYRGRTPPLAETGIPHLTSRNIKNGKIDWNTRKFVSKETYEKYMTRGLPRPGDVIFTMEAPLGEAAVVPDGRRFSLAQRTLLLRSRKGIVEGEFLAKVLMSPQVRERIHEKATATTVKGIAAKRLKDIPLPAPLVEEQHRIVAYLDDLQAKVDALKKLQSETAAELDALMPSILSKAFHGEL
jgi:type I restriction enzyme S subunit